MAKQHFANSTLLRFRTPEQRSMGLSPLGTPFSPGEFSSFSFSLADGIFPIKMQRSSELQLTIEGVLGQKPRDFKSHSEDPYRLKLHEKSGGKVVDHLNKQCEEYYSRDDALSVLMNAPKIVLRSTNSEKCRDVVRTNRSFTAHKSPDEAFNKSQDGRRYHFKKHIRSTGSGSNSRMNGLSGRQPRERDHAMPSDRTTALIPCLFNAPLSMTLNSSAARVGSGDGTVGTSESSPGLHPPPQPLFVGGKIDHICLPHMLQLSRPPNLQLSPHAPGSIRSCLSTSSNNSAANSNGTQVTPLNDMNWGAGNDLSSLRETNSQLLTSSPICIVDDASGDASSGMVQRSSFTPSLRKSVHEKVNEAGGGSLLADAPADFATNGESKLRIRMNPKALIGKGSYGMVFQAMMLDTNRIIAVKEISIANLQQGSHRSHGSDSNDHHSCCDPVVLVGSEREVTPGASSVPVGDGKLPSPPTNNNNNTVSRCKLESVWRELSLMRQMDHPNIVKYLGEEFDGSCMRIYMEYVSGGSISSLLRTFGSFQEGQASNFTRQMLQGMAYLHTKGIVHHDLKGGNLLVDPSGALKLADFGTAQSICSKKRSSKIAGTVCFIAPEVLTEGASSLKSDIWSAGCCVIEMLTGSPPLSHLATQYTIMMMLAESTGELFEHYIPKEHGWSPEAVDFLMQCLQRDPSKRPTAEQLLVHPWLMNPPQSHSAVSPCSTAVARARTSTHKFIQSLSQVGCMNCVRNDNADLASNNTQNATLAATLCSECTSRSSLKQRDSAKRLNKEKHKPLKDGSCYVTPLTVECMSTEANLSNKAGAPSLIKPNNAGELDFPNGTCHISPRLVNCDDKLSSKQYNTQLGSSCKTEYLVNGVSPPSVRLSFLPSINSTVSPIPAPTALKRRPNSPSPVLLDASAKPRRCTDKGAFSRPSSAGMECLSSTKK